MIGLSKPCIVLIVVFAVVFLVIVTQLFHVYWYRKRFRRENSTSGHPEFPGDPFSVPSKELLYFFCWKRQSRVEPHSNPASRQAGVPSAEINDVDVLKWQGLYGPSRVLFTIKEEEREEMEPHAADKSLSLEAKGASLGECFSVADELPEREEMESHAADKSLSLEAKGVSLGECFGVADELPELTAMVGVDEATPFSTPCASPPYFTPSPSPTRDVGNLTKSPEEIGNLILAIKGLERECSESDVSSGSKFSFVSIEVQSD